MNIVLLGKFLIAGGTIAVPAVGYVLWNKYFNNDQWPYVYVVVESVSGATEGASTSDFKCKLEGEDESKKFACKVEQLKWDNKKHLDYSSSTAKEAATAESIKVANNVFKITISKDNNDVFKNTDKKIEISSSKDNKAHVSAKILFTVDESKKIEGKSEYFVAKAPKPNNLTSLTSQEKYQCAWEKTPNSGFKDCEIYDFSSDGDAVTEGSYDDLVFKTPIQKSNAITENKHYLIKFTEATTPKEPNLDKKQIIFIKKGEDASATLVEFKDIKPSFLIDDKLLILGSQPQ